MKRYEKMRKMAAELVSAFDSNPAVWEVRLLSQADTATYVVLCPWDDEQLLVIPFSRGSLPRANWEIFFDISRSAGSCPAECCRMKVLQVWGARTVRKDVLAKTWKIGIFPKEHRKSLREVVRGFLLGERLSPGVNLLMEVRREPLYGAALRSYKEAAMRNLLPLDREDMK